MSYFNQGINEKNTDSFHTKKLKDLDHDFPGIIQSIARVTAVILEHFVNKGEWDWHAEEGSITIQNTQVNTKVIKVFIDDTGKVTKKIPDWEGKNAVVVGIELTYEDPFARCITRDYLKKTFGKYYIDPLKYEKTYLQPQDEHLYDLVVLQNGRCTYEVDGLTVEIAIEKINTEIKNC